ncbi:uncharacterized protein LOC106013932 [Aplysia californica]|uniref:Uncharacterized protein LOC106013932 n=1 Tax=Aplysia californica TaxID=6500 RepID=A0ABM1AER2_APLCA|nr:uncharacterized protein LOC106013932 [Aplysia californica]
MLQTGDPSMNSGFGGCCNVPGDGRSSGSDSNRATAVNGGARGGRRTVESGGNSPMSKDSEFGLTATQGLGQAGKPTGGNSPSSPNVQGVFAFGASSTNWNGEWQDSSWDTQPSSRTVKASGASAKASSGNINDRDVSPTEPKSALSALGLSQLLASSHNAKPAATTATPSVWNGQWKESWPGTDQSKPQNQETSKSPEIPKETMLDILIACLQREGGSMRTCYTSR